MDSLFRKMMKKKRPFLRHSFFCLWTVRRFRDNEVKSLLGTFKQEAIYAKRYTAILLSKLVPRIAYSRKCFVSLFQNLYTIWQRWDRTDRIGCKRNFTLLSWLMQILGEVMDFASAERITRTHASTLDNSSPSVSVLLRLTRTLIFLKYCCL